MKALYERAYFIENWSCWGIRTYFMKQFQLNLKDAKAKGERCEDRGNKMHEDSEYK